MIIKVLEAESETVADTMHVYYVIVTVCTTCSMATRTVYSLVIVYVYMNERSDTFFGYLDDLTFNI